MPFPAAILPFLQAAAYATTIAGGVKALTTDAPENKLQTPGGAAGGQTKPNAQSVFGGGMNEWQQARMGTTPQPVQAPNDSALTAAMTALAQGQQTPPIVNQEPPPYQLPPGWEKNIPAPNGIPQPGLGEFLSGLEGVSGALAAVAPLLGLGQGPQRSMQIGPPAGGQAGPPIFQLPQRNTLAQILASLPRTM